eukprot:214138-Pyramimonas_sp.AAC.1
MELAPKRAPPKRASGGAAGDQWEFGADLAFTPPSKMWTNTAPGMAEDAEEDAPSASPIFGPSDEGVTAPESP